MAGNVRIVLGGSRPLALPNCGGPFNVPPRVYNQAKTFTLLNRLHVQAVLTLASPESSRTDAVNVVRCSERSRAALRLRSAMRVVHHLSTYESGMCRNVRFEFALFLCFVICSEVDHASAFWNDHDCSGLN